MIAVGKIHKTKGFDGTTVVEFFYSVTNENFMAFFIEKGTQYTPLIVESISSADGNYHIRWKKYHSKELAQTLHHQDLYMDEKLFSQHFEEEDNEDVVGYEVYNYEHKIGFVSHIFDHGYQETLEVTLVDDKKLLIPYIDEMILTIDDDQRAIYCALNSEFLTTFTS